MSETLSSSPVTEHARFVEDSTENDETLARFSQGIHELQIQNPEIVGATLFGSRLKGESTAKSDVDCTIFIDADRLEAEEIHTDIRPDGKITWGEHEDLKHDFRIHFGNVLAARTDKDPSVITGGIYIEPISTSLIEKQIEAHVGYLAAEDAYRRDLDVWYEDLDAAESDRPVRPEPVLLAGAIPALFSPELTNELDAYRTDVVDTLAKYGTYGEQAWEEISYFIGFGEGHLDMADPDYYAGTLEQARERYGRSD